MVPKTLTTDKRIYDKGWQSFIANAGMVNYFGSSDQKTAEYFSALCGEQTVWNFSSAVAHAMSSNQGQGGASSGQSQTDTKTTAASQRKLAFPDELMRLRGNTQIAFIEDMHPLRALKENWYDDDVLKTLGVNLHEQEKKADTVTAEDVLNGNQGDE